MKTLQDNQNISKYQTKTQTELFKNSVILFHRLQNNPQAAKEQKYFIYHNLFSLFFSADFSFRYRYVGAMFYSKPFHYIYIYIYISAGKANTLLICLSRRFDPN